MDVATLPRPINQRGRCVAAESVERGYLFLPFNLTSGGERALASWNKSQTRGTSEWCVNVPEASHGSNSISQGDLAPGRFVPEDGTNSISDRNLLSPHALTFPAPSAPPQDR